MKHILLIIIIFLGKTIIAQPLKVNISNLSFISGKWTLQHEWGDMEENWSEPAGDNMMCSYRCIKDGKIVFYEFMVIEQSDSVPVMKLRHFSPGNIGWEEKEKPNTYPLVLLENNIAVFEAADKNLRLSFLRRDNRHLSVILDRKDKNGNWQKDSFDYTLKK